MDDFTYAGIETCAADGLCAAACPVGINTGDYIKRVRAESVKDEKSALRIVNNFALAEKAIGWGVRMGRAAEKVIGANGVKSVSTIAEKITGRTLPKWNHHIPSPSPFRAERSASEVEAGRAARREGEKDFMGWLAGL